MAREAFEAENGGGKVKESKKLHFLFYGCQTWYSNLDVEVIATLRFYTILMYWVEGVRGNNFENNVNFPAIQSPLSIKKQTPTC